MFKRLLPALIALSALIAIAALDGWGLPRAWGFIAKPLTTILILAWAWPRGADEPRMQGRLRLGLLFSLSGDICLLWPQQGFLPGLVSFLLAHLCYIGAFLTRSRLARPRLPFALYALVAGGVLSQLWPGVPAELRVPVLVYVACLSAMAAQAACWWRSQTDASASRWAAIGGGLFVASDALIAIDRFAAPVPHAALFILTLYWLAQCGFVASQRPR